MSSAAWRAALMVALAGWTQTGQAQPPPAAVRVVASDLLGEKFASALQTQLSATGQPTGVALTGSRRGWEELEAGTAQLGLLVFSPTEKVPEAPFFAAPVAYHVVVVAVPQDLPISQLTFPQLAGFFGAEKSQGLQRWGDVGVLGPWQARGIAPKVLAAKQAMTAPLFRHLVLGDRPFAPNVSVHSAAAELTASAPTETGAIVLSATPLGPTAGFREIAVARKGNEAAVRATPENVHRGDYPLRWPMYLVLRRMDARMLLPLVRELLGEEGAARLAEAQLVPMPAAARAELMLQLETLEK